MPLPDDSPEPKGESIYDVPQEPFQPDEPEPVQPTSPSPAPDAPGAFGGTPGEDGEASVDQTAAAQAAEPEPLPHFDERYKDPFTGLIYLGRLTNHVTLWGHEFVIKTLTTEESAEIAVFMKNYEGTRAQNVVYQTCVVALAVLSVDGQEIPGESLGPHDHALAPKYRYVSQNWWPPVRERVFEEVFLLEETVRKVLEQMGNASG